MKSDASEAAMIARIIDQGLVQADQVKECERLRSEMIQRGEPAPTLGEMLLRRGYLSRKGLSDTFRLYVMSGMPAEAARAARQPANAIGRYVRVSPLATDTWKSWDRDLACWIVIKFPKCSREHAEKVRALRHDHIAAVYDAGEHEGRLFVATQFVPGAPLDGFPPERRIAFVRDAALAVQHAHDAGILHLDLSSANVLVEKDRVLVLDFGLSGREGTAKTDVEALVALLPEGTTAERKYGSAGGLAEDLTRVLAGEKLRPPGLLRRIWDSFRGRG